MRLHTCYMASLLIVLALGFAGALAARRWGHWPAGADTTCAPRVKTTARTPFEHGFPILVLASLSIAKAEERP